MKIRKIQLHNFRSYVEREFEFSDSITIITGLNGVGKTNLLEAVHVLATGESFRDSDEILVRYDESWWKVAGDIFDQQREVRFLNEPSRSKQLKVDDVLYKRITYRQKLPVVLFEPDDLLMIHASPGARRQFIDRILLKIDPSYRQVLAKYERTLLQRNNLLKKGLTMATLRDAVFGWDVSLSDSGAEIVQRRMKLIEEFNKYLSDYYSAIAGRDASLNMVYLPKVLGDSQVISRRLYETLGQDVERGFTSIGPHRDDLDFELNGKSAKTTASRGEVRTILLALKQCELQLVFEATGIQPIFLLDDVFSELDEERQKQQLGNTLVSQIIITTTHLPKDALVSAYSINMNYN